MFCNPIKGFSAPGIFAEKKIDQDVEAWNNAWKTQESEYKSLVKGFKSKNDDARLVSATELLGLDKEPESIDEILSSFASDLDQIVKDGSSWIFKRVVNSENIGDEEASHLALGIVLLIKLFKTKL